jgi:hypothetical protein
MAPGFRIARKHGSRWDLGFRATARTSYPAPPSTGTLSGATVLSVSRSTFVGPGGGFVDAGLAWDESRELALNESIGGYGFGLRILVPFVNMIRLDFAWGQPGGGMSVYMAIWEKAIMERARVR